MAKVVFYPSETIVDVVKGQSLLDAALENNIAIHHACGGNCACTTCRVRIVSGSNLLSSPEPSETLRLAMGRRQPSPSWLRLACQTELISESGVVEVVVLGITEPESPDSP